MKKKIMVLLAVFSLGACSQYTQQSNFCAEGISIEIPYVQGDSSGILTDRVIEEFASTFPGQLADHAPVALQVKWLGEQENNIGFQYEKNDQGEIQEKIIPNENRIKASVEVKLIDKLSGKTLLGPEIVTASNEYDFDFDAIKNQEMPQSLGQLNGLNEARLSARSVLASSLAKKIVSMLKEIY